MIKVTKSNMTFYLGDGVEVKTIKFLVTIGDAKVVRVYIEADIVKNDIPLLFGHKSMKTVGMLLDFKNDSCRILGRYLKSESTTSGDYSLPLTNVFLEVECCAPL